MVAERPQRVEKKDRAGVSKAFTKDDGPEVGPLLRRRAPLPEGTPNYVTPRGLRALRNKRQNRPPRKHGNIPL